MVYLVIILIFMGIVLNKISKKYSLFRLDYKRALSEYAVEIGEEFEITTIIENNKLIPVTFLQIIEKVPGQLSYRFPTEATEAAGYIFHKTTMFIMPKQRIKRKFQATFNKRGRYTFRDVSLIAGDFLGLSTVSKSVEYMQEMIVYPSALDMDSSLTPYGSYYGDISVKRWIISDPILSVGIREYTGVEPQKNIHWASSLKSGKLMVKNFDFTTDNRVMIILNIECYKPFWNDIRIDDIEKCISTARTVMEQFETMGIPYGFSTNIQCNEFVGGKYYIPYGHGSVHFYDILELLGRADYAIGLGYEEILSKFINNRQEYTTYILITPSILEEYIENINILSKIVNKTVLISMKEKNIIRLNENIMVYLGKEN